MNVEAPAALVAAIAALTGAVLSWQGNRAARRRESVDRRVAMLLDHSDTATARQDNLISRQDQRIQDLEAQLALSRRNRDNHIDKEGQS